MTPVDLSELLTNLDDDVKNELASSPEVVDKSNDLNVEELPITARKWHKLDDVVAVVADLKTPPNWAPTNGQHPPPVSTRSPQEG